jgi:hypothetical protein
MKPLRGKVQSGSSSPLRRIAAARKQQALRPGACPPLFRRTRPGNFPARRRRKWISHTSPPNRERFTLSSPLASENDQGEEVDPQRRSEAGLTAKELSR